MDGNILLGDGVGRNSPVSSRLESVQRSGPGKFRDAETTFPQFFEMKALHGHVCELEDGPASVCDDLGGDVDELSAQGDWHGRYRDDWSRDVLFESFEDEKGDEHAVIEGRVRSKSQKRQLLEPKVLQGAVDEFIRAPAMVGGDNAFRLNQAGESSLFELFVHGKAHAEVGVRECTWPASREKKLFFFKERSPEDRPSEAVPGSPPIAELKEFPDVLVGAAKVALKIFWRHGFKKPFDFGKKAPATDVANAESVNGFHEFLVAEA